MKKDIATDMRCDQMTMALFWKDNSHLLKN